LPDHNGVVKEGKKWMSTPMDIAKEILSSKLAASCLIAQVNGEPWDMTRPLEDSCELKLLDFDTVEGCATFWRSSALILGEVSSKLAKKGNVLSMINTVRFLFQFKFF
jgi:threonyl-tRNA synthetase